MKSRISLENLDNYIISFDEIEYNRWIFEDTNGNIPIGIQSQVFPLKAEANIFLRKFEETQKVLKVYPNQKYFKTVEQLNFFHLKEADIKRWLYDRGIPFAHRVIWRNHTTAFIMTWKMVIKFADDIFSGQNGLIWDSTLNWTLGFEHNYVLYWGKDRIYNNDVQQKEIDAINRLINQK